MKLVIDISEEYYKTIKETKKEVVPIGWVSIQEGIEYKEKPQGKWEYLKEHITEMRDADGKLNQKETCQFILNLMGVIEKEGDPD